MKYSIVIPNFNNVALIKKCLEAIRKNTKGLDHEVIVVDDCSSDDSRKFLSSQKDIVYLENKTNQGFAKTNNVGVEKSTGDVIILLNSDTEVHPGWLEAIDRVFQAEKNIGAVGVKLLYPDGTIQHAGVMIAADHAPRHIYKAKPANYKPANHQRDYKEVTAACMAIPKDKYNEVGGLDEAFRNGFEDIDMCLKLYHLGNRIIYTPEAVVTHHESVAPGRFKHEDKNFELYMSRWKDEEPDAHKYYREDGRSWLWILWNDLYIMSWGPDRFGTRPTWIKFARLLFIPLNKIYTFLTLLFSGDIAGIKEKLKGDKDA
ncbi:MAG: glycosyltransferase family 2 protein [bacterium]